MPNIIIRIASVMLATLLAAWVLLSELTWRLGGSGRLAVASAIVGIAVVAVALSAWVVKRWPVAALNAVVGLLLGLICAWLITTPLVQLVSLPEWLRAVTWGVVAIVASLVSVESLVANDVVGTLLGSRKPAAVTKPSAGHQHAYLLDTSAIIDGRIADLVGTGILGGPLIVPNFVVAELQGIADSSDKLKRGRGRRGLDMLTRLRETAQLELFERELPEFADQPVDARLVMLAKHLSAAIVTGDFNLNKVAHVSGVKVVNLNDVANALRPAYLPGECFDLQIVKAGEEPGQGVGYLSDGTMVVVSDSREKVQQTVRVAVTSVLQTSAGRMVFGRLA